MGSVCSYRFLEVKLNNLYPLCGVEKKKNDCILLMWYVPCYLCREPFAFSFFELKHINILKYVGFHSESKYQDQMWCQMALQYFSI